MPVPFEIDPNLMCCRALKKKDPTWGGGTFYRTMFIQNSLVVPSRKQFKRATEAIVYGERVIARLRRLKAVQVYD